MDVSLFLILHHSCAGGLKIRSPGPRHMFQSRKVCGGEWIARHGLGSREAIMMPGCKN